MQVHLPDALYRADKERDLPASELLQSAVRDEVRRQSCAKKPIGTSPSSSNEIGPPSVKAVARAEALSRRIRRGARATRTGVT
jgi:hypothetical protein